MVIKKGRGNRPDEALATLYYKEGATFYLKIYLWEDNIRKLQKKIFFIFNNL
jgi:hypothetical protein